MGFVVIRDKDRADELWRCGLLWFRWRDPVIDYEWKIDNSYQWNDNYGYTPTETWRHYEYAVLVED